MIVDRTITDVEQAKEIRTKIQQGETITEEEIATFERGFCLRSTLNRIELKMAEIVSNLLFFGYPIDIVTKTWTRTEIFDEEEHQRLLDNLDKLKTAFATFKTTPQTPTYMYGYQEMNAIEQILVDIEQLIMNMESQFLYSSSENYSGGMY